MSHRLPRITVEGVVVGQRELVPELIGPQADRTLEPCDCLIGPAVEQGEQAPFKAGPRIRFGRRPCRDARRVSFTPVVAGLEDIPGALGLGEQEGPLTDRRGPPRLCLDRRVGPQPSPRGTRPR